MKKWAVYYTTAGTSPTRVIVDAETADEAIEQVRRRVSRLRDFEAYANRW